MIYVIVDSLALFSFICCLFQSAFAQSVNPVGTSLEVYESSNSISVGIVSISQINSHSFLHELRSGGNGSLIASIPDQLKGMPTSIAVFDHTILIGYQDSNEVLFYNCVTSAQTSIKSPNKHLFGTTISNVASSSGHDYFCVAAETSGQVFLYDGLPSAFDLYEQVLEGLPSSGYGRSLRVIDNLTGNNKPYVIVGGPYTSDSLMEYGKIYLYSGQPFVLVDSISGPCEYSHFGSSLSSGDVNGDSYHDLVVSAPGSGNHHEGAVYVYYGGPHFDTTPDKAYYGTQADELFGNSILAVDRRTAMIGGLAIGSYNASHNGQSRNGALHWYNITNPPNSKADTVIYGEASSDHMGWASAFMSKSATSDSCAILYSSPYNSSANSIEGKVHVLDLFKPRVKGFVINTYPENIGLKIKVENKEYRDGVTLESIVGTPYLLYTQEVQYSDSTNQQVRWRFDRWSDGGERIHNVTAEEGTVITAYFKKEVMITSSVLPNCGSTGVYGTIEGNEWHQVGTSETLTAIPSPGAMFSGWEGAVSQTSETLTHDFTEPTTVIARFKLQNPEIDDVLNTSISSNDLSMDIYWHDNAKGLAEVWTLERKSSVGNTWSEVATLITGNSPYRDTHQLIEKSSYAYRLRANSCDPTSNSGYGDIDLTTVLGMDSVVIVEPQPPLVIQYDDNHNPLGNFLVKFSLTNKTVDEFEDSLTTEFMVMSGNVALAPGEIASKPYYGIFTTQENYIATWECVPAYQPSDDLAVVAIRYYRTPERADTAYSEPIEITHTIVGIESPPSVQSYRLFQNYPNPFSGNTTILFYASSSATVSLVIHDILGHPVYKRGIEPTVGLNRIDISGLPSGSYLYVLQTNEGSLSGIMIAR